MNKKVLIIDDDRAVRRTFDLIFEDSEFSLEMAENGQQGIDMDKANNYDFIFLDLKMPGLNGVETLKELRIRSSSKPIYIVTAFHQEFLNQLMAVREAGIMFEVINKPVDDEDVLTIEKSILDSSIAFE